MFEASLLEAEAPPTYQKIALEALRLKQLGLSNSRIAKALEVTDKNCRQEFALEERAPSSLLLPQVFED